MKTKVDVCCMHLGGGGMKGFSDSPWRFCQGALMHLCLGCGASWLDCCSIEKRQKGNLSSWPHNLLLLCLGQAAECQLWKKNSSWEVTKNSTSNCAAIEQYFSRIHSHVLPAHHLEPEIQNHSCVNSFEQPKPGSTTYYTISFIHRDGEETRYVEMIVSFIVVHLLIAPVRSSLQL